jgi:hypothetical protein
VRHLPQCCINVLMRLLLRSGFLTLMTLLEKASDFVGLDAFMFRYLFRRSRDLLKALRVLDFPKPYMAQG